MQTIENDMVVQVHYTGTLDNGDVFDASQKDKPLEVKVGQGQVIVGFEKALMGMALNEKKTVSLTPEEAYGERDDNAQRDFPRSEIPPDVDVQVGQMVALMSPQGQQVPATIVKLDDENVTVDLNHPLAGKTLTFDIEVVKIDAAEG